MIRKLKSKDLDKFISYCQKRDYYSDFYITYNNHRKFLSDPKIAKQIFFKILKHGDKCYIVDDGDIQGILLVCGYSDKAYRKYIKILANRKEDIRKLLKLFFWDNIGDYYLKLKQTNPIVKIAQEYKFDVFGYRGKEILMHKKLYRKEA